MKSSLVTVAIVSLLSGATAVHAELVITGVIDGPRSGGKPKAIELHAVADIGDLSIYNVETPNNGGDATGSEFALSGSADRGDFIWIATETPEFTAYFGFAPTFTSNAANINGDDNVLLYRSGTIIDQFGVNGEDGSGKEWEYEDGFAYRKDSTGPDAIFNPNNWDFSGPDFLDSQGDTGTNGSDGKTVPFGTYSNATAVPEPGGLLGLAAIGIIGIGKRAYRRRRIFPSRHQ